MNFKLIKSKNYYSFEGYEFFDTGFVNINLFLTMF